MTCVFVAKNEFIVFDVKNDSFIFDSKNVFGMAFLIIIVSLKLPVKRPAYSLQQYSFRLYTNIFRRLYALF